jgi:hypothetical protein
MIGRWTGAPLRRPTLTNEQRMGKGHTEQARQRPAR